MTLSPIKRLRRRGGTVYGTTLRAMSAAAAACFLALAASAQILGTTNTLDNVLMTTPMWSLADPFGFTVLSNVETMVSDNNAAHTALSNYTDSVALTRVLVVSGVSTNQLLYAPFVTNVLSFGTSFATALSAGQIAWDPDWMTFRAGLGNGVEGQFFQEQHVYAKNASGAVISNGWVVMHSDAVGNSGKYEVVPAVSTVGMRRGAVLGMATEDIAIGALGRITTCGNVNELGSSGVLYGSSGWHNNAPVYLSHTHAGWVATNAPPAPYATVLVGNVVSAHNTVGTIYINVRGGMSLKDLDDVDGTPLAASGQLPVWDQTRGVFDFTENVNRYATTNAVSSHTNRTDNPHGVTAAQTGALTNEQDLAALRLYHYGSTGIIESPASAFTFNPGTGEIGAYDLGFGSDVVVPWSIDGAPVTTISSSVFAGSSLLTSLVLPRSVVSISAFAFDYCVSLTAVTFSASAPAASSDIYANIPANQVTNYVTSSTATGWSSTLGGMPVVRLPLYTDAVYENGIRLVPMSGVTGGVDLTPAAYVRVPEPSAGSDAATMDAVRRLLEAGNPYYATTNRANVAYEPTNAAFFSSLTIPATAAVAVNVPSNNAYVLSMTSPTRLTGELRGPMSVEAHLFAPAGVPSANYLLSVKPELYYTTDTNNPALTLGDWGATPQAITPGVTNLYRWTIPFPNKTVTNAWVIVRLKSTVKGSSANSLTLLTGTDYPSFALLRTPGTETLGDRGATNLTVGATSVPYDATTRTFDGALLDPALPYRVWTGVVTPANGTATVAYAHGNMPVLTISGATVLTLDPAGYGTGGVSRVSLTLWTGTNTLTLATNVVSYAATPTVSTNAWNTILFRRAGDSSWKGVGL